MLDNFTTAELIEELSLRGAEVVLLDVNTTLEEIDLDTAAIVITAKKEEL